MHTPEYLRSQHPIEELQQRLKRLERACIILSISVILFALIGIHSALRVRRMVNIVESTAERIRLTCDEIEDALNSQPQSKKEDSKIGS